MVAIAAEDSAHCKEPREVQSQNHRTESECLPSEESQGLQECLVCMEGRDDG